MQSTPRPEFAPALVAGHLEGVSVADLLSSLSQRRLTGVLAVHRDSVSKKLYVQDGRIVFAASSDPNERLGEMLLRRGKISIDQLEAALSQLPSGKRLGALLVHGGALTPDGLVEAVMEQVKSIVLDAIGWDMGAYTFHEGPLPTQELITLQMKTGELLLQGMRRIRSLSRIRRGIGPPTKVYELAAHSREAAEGLILSEGELLILEQLVHGPESIERLCGKLALSNFDVYQAVWAFHLLGIVQESDRPLLDSPGRGGTLAVESFSDILMRLGHTAETGILTVHHGPIERTLHFERGRCVFATSSDPDDSLMSYLLRRGVISLADREEVGRRLLSNRRVGTILCDIGVLDDDDLRGMVRGQLTEIVLDTFRWDSGAWAFKPGPLPTVEEITLDIELESLLAQGARRAGSWTRVIRGCGGIDNPLVLTPLYLDVLDKTGAGVEEWLVVNALKTPQTPRRICRMVDLGDYRICQILWTLVLLGAVKTQSEEELAESAAATVLLTSGEITAALAEPPPVPVEAAAPSFAEPPQPEPSFAPPEPLMAAEPPQLDPEPNPIIEETSTDAGHTMRLTREEVDAALEAPPPGEGSYDWQPPADLDQATARFNAMHRLVYRTVRAEIGAGAVNFVRSCCDQLTTDWTVGAKLRPDGTWDAGELRKAIVQHRIEDPENAYRQLIEREIDLLRAHLGEHRAVELQQQIHDLGLAYAPS